MKLKRTKIFLVFVTLALGLTLRLYKLDTPLADWHSWRQVDTVAVTRHYVQNGINLLVPKYNDLSANPSTIPNPEGYRMVEFPVINALTASLYKLPLVNQLPLHVFSRIVSIAFSLGSILLLYLIVSHLSGFTTGFWAALFMSILPYNVYYSRTTLPEVPLVFFSLMAIYLSLKNKLILSSIFAALSMLIKPYALIFALPIGYYLLSTHRLKLLKDKKFYLYLPIAILPYIFWRQWIQQFPEGIPQYLWLLNSGEIRFKGAFFNWLFAERLGKLILGFWGLILFGLGLSDKPAKKEGWFYYLWLIAILVYLSVFASGNVHHDYYQIITIPIVCIMIAKGTVFLLSHAKKNLVAYAVLAVTILFTLAFSWFHVRGYYNINHWEIVQAGQAADKLLSKDAKVIAPYNKDTAFLFQTNRSGWPNGGDLEAKVKAGATHYVTVNKDTETNSLIDQNCPVLEQTDQYLIIEIKDCLAPIED